MSEKLDLSKSLLIKKYIKENKTTTEISKELNCGRQTVCNYLHLYNIPINQNYRTSRYGEFNPFWHGGKPKCKQCDKALSAYHCELCSDCYTTNLSGKNNPMFGIRRFGKESPNYIHGLSYLPYTEKFNKYFKFQIRQRDTFQCQICNIFEKECNCSLSIHHINYNKFDNRLSNLISLCRECHLKTNGNRDYWFAYCTYLMENK
jgi:hypothetical protein